MSKTVTFRKLVKPEDMNPGHTLFGGRMMEWLDEAAALYVMCQLQTDKVVTLKISEILFKEPVRSGDFLIFEAEVTNAGRTSLTINLDVFKFRLANDNAPFTSTDHRMKVLECQMVFVAVDDDGKPTPHRLHKI